MIKIHTQVNLSDSKTVQRFMHILVNPTSSTAQQKLYTNITLFVFRT